MLLNHEGKHGNDGKRQSSCDIVIELKFNQLTDNAHVSAVQQDPAQQEPPELTILQTVEDVFALRDEADHDSENECNEACRGIQEPGCQRESIDRIGQCRVDNADKNKTQELTMEMNQGIFSSDSLHLILFTPPDQRQLPIRYRQRTFQMTLY